MHKHLILICTTLLLSACSGFFFPGVYKIDIPQGNIIEAEQVSQLKVGMTEDQVRYLLGTPLIVDGFNPGRWDYYYSLRAGSRRPNKGETERDRLTLFFDDGLLARIDDQNPDRQVDIDAGPEAEVEQELDRAIESPAPAVPATSPANEAGRSSPRRPS